MEKTNKVKENLKKAYDATDNFLDKTSNSFVDFVKKYDILIFMIIISLLGIVMRILIFQKREENSWLVQLATTGTSLHITTSNGIVNHRLKKYLPPTGF